MKTLKSSKSRGFTLIELMVVIAIIALLSSVVLAALKDARQRTENAKVAAEMKSVQYALELYRNQFGTYPDNILVGEAEICGTIYCPTGFNSFIKTYLVDNKFLSKVIQSKNYPNNCINSECYYGNMFMYWGEFTAFNNTAEPEIYYTCGEQKVLNYVLLYITHQKLNLPKFYSHYDGYVSTGIMASETTYTPPDVPYEYCISG